MNTNDTATNSQIPPDVAKKIEELTSRAKGISQEIEETNRQSKTGLDAIAKDVDATVADIEKGFAELDKIEQQAADEFDTHMLQQAVDLASEDE